MKRNQKGFTAIETVLVILFVILIVLTGYWVWHNDYSSNAKNTATAGNTASPSTPIKSYADCVEADGGINPATMSTLANCTIYGKQYTEAVGGDANLANWITVSKPQVTLSHYNIQITLPADAVNNVIYNHNQSDFYAFATKAIVSNPTCSTYIEQQEGPTDTVGIEFWQYAGSVKAKSQISGVNDQSISLSQYYELHKAATGNYIVDPGSGQKYWKVGDNFYTAFTNPSSIYQGSGFNQACPGASGDYEQEITNAMSTLTAI